jgi:hypothetical protein
MQKIKNLYAFDFDDTLAVTPSIIGVQRVGKDGKADPNFREWIHENNIDFHDIENPGSDSEIVWFTSGDFAKYEKAHKNDIEYLELNFLKDQYDFTKTASIDVDASLPIDTMMSILKKAYSEPNSRVVIITARSGSKPMTGISKNKKIVPTNQQDIKNFLNAQGIKLNQANITTAGDIGGGPEAKVQAMEKYINIYNPDNIYFYDDNHGNIEAIISMCDQYFPEIKIKAFKVSSDRSVSFAGGC